MKRLTTVICAMLSAGMALAVAAEPARPVKSAWPDALRLKSGAVLPCRVDGIGTDGKVRLRTPLIDGVVSALPAHVKRLEMSTTAVEDAGTLAVILSNGDRVAGDLVDMTDDVVVVNSPVVGEVEIPRPVVRCIVATSDAAGPVWSDFASGFMEPWQSKTGALMVREGALQSTDAASRSDRTAWAPLKQVGPVTIEVVVGGGRGSSMGVLLWLFASDWLGSSYGNGIRADMRLGRASVLRYIDRSARSVWRGGPVEMDRNTPRATYTVAYDPENGKIKVWINAKPAGVFVVDKRLPVGREVAIGVHYRTRILRATVRPGVHPPTEGGERPANKGGVAFKNGDFLSVTRGLAVIDEQLVIDTPDGELRCPFETIAHMELPSSGIAMPRRNAGDVRVRLRRGTLTMQITEMSRTTLRGRSDCLGELRLPRKLVRSIEYDIYR